MSSLAYLLPGQGAQAVGMGKAFYDRFPESRDFYKRANTHIGFDLTALCFDGPQEKLTQTEFCQPALLVTSVAAYAAFRTVWPASAPAGAAGLSLGELTALTVAEAMSFQDALYLVQARAVAMAECAAHHPGAMLAVIGLLPDAVQEVCKQAGVTAANLNAQDQVVLSGTAPAIGSAEGLAKAAGAKRALRLDVAGAFHSPLMQEASDTFRRAVSKVSFAQPKFPVISNVTGRPVPDAREIPDLLVKQIVSPVQWEASMKFLVGRGAGVFVEFPPARVLTGLLRKIDPSVKGVAVEEPDDFDKISPLLSPSVSS